MSDRPIIRVTLDLTPVRDGCDIALFVRWALKVALRTYGFRAVRHTWTDTEKPCTPLDN